ncbi:PREDICTED: uncharacterized protein LOC108564015 [Nicrophorus vespilloides]|uniref:Uncharacterized protein LOC108564015 n=1 Tax=Nicrophorus vespilloides TaxID=110193 RepID=A0ABM1MUX6_NICVS|nr:PREDICTED: uncharacterized protein LOC108564015 [Nicrophorus vespilloides]
MNRTIFFTIFALILINYASAKPILEAEPESPNANEITTTIEVTEKPSTIFMSFLALLLPISKPTINDENLDSKTPEMRLQRIERQAKLINGTEEGDAPFVSILRQIMTTANALEKPALIDESEAPFVSTLLMRILPKSNGTMNINEMKEFVSTLLNSTKTRVFNATEKLDGTTERIDNKAENTTQISDNISEKTLDEATESIENNSQKTSTDDNSEKTVDSLSLGTDDKTTEIGEKLNEKSVEKDDKLLREFEDSIKFLTQNFGGIFPPQQIQDNVKVNQLSSKTDVEKDKHFEESGNNCDFPYPAAIDEESVNGMMKRSEGSGLENDENEDVDYDLVILDKRIKGNDANETNELKLSKNVLEVFDEVVKNFMKDDGIMIKVESESDDGVLVNDLLGLDEKLKVDEKSDDDDEIVVNNFGNVWFLAGKVDLDDKTNVILDTRNQVDVEESSVDDELLINDEENEVGGEGFEVLEKEHRKIFELVRNMLEKLN